MNKDAALPSNWWGFFGFFSFGFFSILIPQLTLTTLWQIRNISNSLTTLNIVLSKRVGNLQKADSYPTAIILTNQVSLQPKNTNAI